MRNITAPRTVSFEEALRNLASRLTGVPVSSLPRTQEGIVQFMAENLPTVDVDGLAEAVTKEVLARLGKLPDETTVVVKDTAETNEDAPNLTADGTNTAEVTVDTPDTQNGSKKATGAAKRTKNKSTD